jgi:hypothetical protein
VWWSFAPRGVQDGAAEIWDRAGRAVWRSDLRSATAATFDSTGTLLVLGAVNEVQQRGPIFSSADPPDAPQVLERLGPVPERRELCAEACLGKTQLVADQSGGVFLLATFNGKNLLGWQFTPQSPPLAVNWVLAAFDGIHPSACASLTTTHARLAARDAGAIAVLTENVYGPALVNGRFVGHKGDISLLRFVLDDATSNSPQP